MQLLIAGHTCAGKTFLQKKYELMGRHGVISYTTRPPREEEVRGEDYYFITEEEFVRKIASNDFIEYTIYPGTDGKRYLYGATLREYQQSSTFVLDIPGIIQLDEKDLIKDIPIYVMTIDYDHGFHRFKNSTRAIGNHATIKEQFDKRRGEEEEKWNAFLKVDKFQKNIIHIHNFGV